MTPTKKEIEEAIEELKKALLEVSGLNQEDEKLQLKKQKAHYELNLARDKVRNL